MNRLEEIANKIKLGWPENQGEYLSQCPEDFYNGMSKGMHLLIEALNPEIGLMLKEQAKMVKDAAIGKIENLVDRSKEDGFNVSESDRKAVFIFSRVCATIKSNLDDLQHDWVKLGE